MSKKLTIETFDWAQLDKYLQFKITLKMASELMECGETTIKNYIKQKHNMTFTEYSDLKMSKVKVKLVQKALDMAFNGSVPLMIFSLKNICGWADKLEQSVSQETVQRIIEIKKADEQSQQDVIETKAVDATKPLE